MPKSALQKEILCGEAKGQSGPNLAPKPISAEPPSSLTRTFRASFSGQVSNFPSVIL